MIALEKSTRPDQAVYRLARDESWVEFQLDFLIEMRPAWALEAAIRVKDGTGQFVCELKGLESLETLDAADHFPPGLGEVRLQAVLDAYAQARDALFNESQIGLTPSQIFLDPDTGQVRLLVLPVHRPDSDARLEALVRSIAVAYHIKPETLDRYLKALPDQSSAQGASSAVPACPGDPSPAKEQDPGAAARQVSRGPVPISRRLKSGLVISHLALPGFYLVLQTVKAGPDKWPFAFTAPAWLVTWGYPLLALLALALLSLDLLVTGFLQQASLLAAKGWQLVRNKPNPRSGKPGSGKIQTCRQGELAPADQTELIQVQAAAYRLGLLSVGMPGTPEETEGLRAYILVDEFLVGRDDAVCDLPLAATSVGRRHARITRREGSFFITDLGSKNGTSLDGRRLNKLETYLLPDRCRLEFADQAFYFAAD